MDEHTWSDDEISTFDRLIDKTGSHDQVERIVGRMELRKFVEQHGKEKCDAMFAHLESKRED